MASYRPHDYEKDVDLITLLDKKNKLEEAESYNSPETIARKRKAVKAARRLSARQLSTSTEYAKLPIRPRATQADGKSLDFDDAMDPTEINADVAPEITAEKTKKKNRRRNRPRVNSTAALARVQAQKAAGEAAPEPKTDTPKRKAEVVEESTPMSTPQRRSARIKSAKTQQERDEELILSQLETA